MGKRSRVEEMKWMRHEERMTLQEIGEAFGISRERVRQLIGNTGGLGKVDLLKQDIGYLRDKLYYDQDVTVAQIASKYGLAEVTVRKVLGPRWKYLLNLGMRRCYRCHKIKPTDEFGLSNNRYKQMRISGVCRECNNASAKQYYQRKKAERH